MSSATHTHAQGHHAPHAVPKRILLAVYFALMVLTIITVGVSYIDLGKFNIVVAMAVAVVKAALVALFFMHLFWDSIFNSIVLLIALFFVALFISFATIDTDSYHPNLQPPQSVLVAQ